MSHEEETFEKGESGASETYPLSVGEIKKGGYMVFNGRPCKVVDYTTSKTGKHGHAKAHLTGIDIFNGNKYEDSVPTSHNVEIPNISRTEWTAISVDGEGYLTLMDLTGSTRQDLKLPNESDSDETLAQRIQDCLDQGKDITVTVLSAMGIEKIIEMSEK